MKELSVLGSTGSIGTQTIELLREFSIHPCALTTNKNVTLLEAQAREFHPELVVAYDEAAAKDLKVRLADTKIRVECGMDGLVQAASMPKAECVLTAVVGMVGLLPTLAAIDAKKDIALANKETLVCAGELVTRRAKEEGVKLLPVDSEHSAIFQCLRAGRDSEVKKILLTASGGPFFGKTKEELKHVTLEQALRHPNWAMGSKITIDSASLMNKGLEFIEAMWLFGVTPDQIEVVVHRESIIHSMVEFADGAVIAQLGAPDMKLPIAYALNFPNRIPFDGKPLDFRKLSQMTFATPDLEAFPCLSYAMDAARIGKLAGAVLNGANEAAVALFLQEKIGFSKIGELVGSVMETMNLNETPTLEAVLAADRAARELVYSNVGLSPAKG
ncbi:MAG: 1-deoxy-D-xylulose-5-phosphate reductoisomerase [Oscillospiraceae bacterium]|nr:1-deoxy-D-xylulose-5-phosphate reductoisomerase [Oscillospiraceae bacterium]